MRTTLTLEDSLAAKVRAVARKGKLSFKQVVNDALRKGLEAVDQPRKSTPFRIKPIMSGLKPGIDFDKINQFLDEEEAENFLAKMRRGK